jgi:hypothetical protein
MVLRLRLAGPPFRPWLRMPAANSGLSMGEAAPPVGVGEETRCDGGLSGFPVPEAARDCVR